MATAKPTSFSPRKELPILSYRDIVKGIDAALVLGLIERNVLERSDIEQIIPARTFGRRVSQHEKLKTDEADAVARLLRVRAHAMRAFDGDEAAAEDWLRLPNPALADEVPMEMARTDLGAREVEAVLTRFEHGVFG